MKQATEEYWNARILMSKAFRKMGYRIDKLDLEELQHKWKGQKNEIFKQLRKMDKLLREIISTQNRKVYK